MMSCSDSKIEQNGASPSYWRIDRQALAATGEDLVRVGLVADVPEHLVARRVEQAVQRHSQLAGAEVGAKMAADLADRVDDVGAHLLRHLLQLSVVEAVQVGRAVDAVEQVGRVAVLIVGCVSVVCHSSLVKM